MACADTNDLNKLFAEAQEGKPTVTLKYGLYINWGRPNHNPSRIMNVAQGLADNGYGVQFEHDEAGEHFIVLCVDGKEVLPS